MQKLRCRTRKRNWGGLKTRLGDTELRASAAGVITARKLEIGQVVDAGQSVFTLAQDGDRDAIFDVDERILLGDTERSEVALKLLLGFECHSSRTRKGRYRRQWIRRAYSAREGRNSKSGARHASWKRCSRDRQI